MVYQAKEITVDSWTATVDVEDMSNPSGVPTVIATAKITVGEVLVQGQASATLSPVDGGFGVMPLDHVQQSLDAVRQRAARIAAFRATIEQQKQAAT